MLFNGQQQKGVEANDYWLRLASQKLCLEWPHFKFMHVFFAELLPKSAFHNDRTLLYKSCHTLQEELVSKLDGVLQKVWVILIFSFLYVFLLFEVQFSGINCQQIMQSQAGTEKTLNILA